MDILQLKVTLDDIDPPVTRTVQLSADSTLPELHALIQRVFEWEGYHFYQFVRGEHRYGPRSERIDLPELEDDASIRLEELLTSPHAKLLYEYDFGDGWVHEIELQKRLAAEPGVKYPLCIDGERAGPPEDCGGAPGYAELLEQLQDPQHAGHDTAVEWMGADFDPDRCDRQELNRRLEPLRG